MSFLSSERSGIPSSPERRMDRMPCCFSLRPSDGEQNKLPHWPLANCKSPPHETWEMARLDRKNGPTVVVVHGATNTEKTEALVRKKGRTRAPHFVDISFKRKMPGASWPGFSQGSNLLHHRQIPLVDALTGFKAGSTIVAPGECGLLSRLT